MLFISNAFLILARDSRILGLSLAKIKNVLEVDSVQRGSVTCYMDENHGPAEFW